MCNFVTTKKEATYLFFPTLFHGTSIFLPYKKEWDKTTNPTNQLENEQPNKQSKSKSNGRSK